MIRPSEAAISGFIRHLHAGARPSMLESMLTSSAMRESYGDAMAVAYTHDFPVSASPLPPDLAGLVKSTAGLAGRQPLMMYAHQLAVLAAGLRNADVVSGWERASTERIPPMSHYLDFASEFLAGAYERAQRDFPTTIQRSITA